MHLLLATHIHAHRLRVCLTGVLFLAIITQERTTRAMETLHKLAGISNPPDLQQSQPASTVATSDPDTAANPPLTHRASRASLPLNRQPSHKSFRSSRQRTRSISPVGVPEDYPPPPISKEIGAADHGSNNHAAGRRSEETGTASGAGESEGTEDFAWGPSHPCFPHPNPHCAPDSEEYKTTRVIRVRRDWLQAGDLYPQYANLYPEILDPLVSDADFRLLISTLNTLLKNTYDPFTTRAWLDSVLGVATGWLWEDFGWSKMSSGWKRAEEFLREWNEGCRRDGREVRVVGGRETGGLGLDFVVPDPGLDGEEEAGFGAAV